MRISLTRRIMKDALGVPLAALIPEKGLHVAYVVENGHAVRKEVRLQAMFGDLAVVSDGVRAGDRVIVEGQRQVSDGSPVKEGGVTTDIPAEAREPAAKGT